MCRKWLVGRVNRWPDSVPKMPNPNVHNSNADPLPYEVSASVRFMVADQPGRVPNKAETCAVLQRCYTGERHVPSALNANRLWLN